MVGSIFKQGIIKINMAKEIEDLLEDRQMKREDIEREALRYFHQANQGRVKGDIEQARDKMAIAWGFARYAEDIENMKRFTRSLRRMKLTIGGIIIYQNEGYEEALRIMGKKFRDR